MNPQINRLLLATALLGTFFAGTTTRIFNISMPTVASALHTDLLGISWALLAYQLSNIGLSMIFGRLGDQWGRDRIFGAGFAVFAAGSLLCGLSQSIFQLIAFRLVQGIGASMLQSSSRARGRGRAGVAGRGRAGLHDDGASHRISSRTGDRRHHDRLSQLALGVFLSRADRRGRRRVDTGEYETAARAGGTPPDRLSGRAPRFRYDRHAHSAARPPRAASNWFPGADRFRLRLSSLSRRLSRAREKSAASFRRLVALQDADVHDERHKPVDRGDVLYAVQFPAAVLYAGSSRSLALHHRHSLHGPGGADAIIRARKRLSLGSGWAAAARKPRHRILVRLVSAGRLPAGELTLAVAHGHCGARRDHQRSVQSRELGQHDQHDAERASRFRHQRQSRRLRHR